MNSAILYNVAIQTLAGTYIGWLKEVEGGTSCNARHYSPTRAHCAVASAFESAKE